MPLESLTDDDMRASPLPQSSGVQATAAPPPPLAPLNDPSDQPGFMQRTWHTIQGIPAGLMTLGRGVVEGATTDTAAGDAGVKRGIRDFTDKLLEYPNPEYGAPLSDEFTAAAKKQNAADRDAFEQHWGNHPAASAGRTIGNTIATLPITAPLGAGTGAVLGASRTLLPAFMSRGVPGAIVNAGERAVTGATGGATQAAATADPSKPLGPQIEAGATTGAVLPAGGGVVGDVISDAISRLRGNTIKPPGGLLPADIERARQAQMLIDKGVPVMASEVSADPVLQTSAKYGGAAPGSGMQTFLRPRSDAYQTAVLKDAGDTTGSSVANADFFTNHNARVDQLYNNSVGAVGSIPGGKLGLDLDAIRSQIPAAMTDAEKVQINNALDHVQKTFDAGGNTISGSDYQLIRDNLSPLFDGSTALGRLGKQLKGLVDTKAQGVMTPDQIAMFKAANDQYRAGRTLKAAAGSDGQFTPGELYAKTADATEKYGAPGLLDDIATTGNTVIQPTLTKGMGTTGRVGGTAALGGAGVLGATTAAALKLATIDALTTGGAGLLGALGAGGANRFVQSGNYGGGPRAIAATGRAGRPPSPSELQQALALLRPVTRAAVSQSVQQQNADQ
jgi:hypothetical protein